MFFTKNTFKNQQKPCKTLTMTQVLTDWLSLKQSGWKPSTRSAYETVINKYLIPHVGNIPVEEFNETAIRDCVNELRQLGLSRSQLGKLSAVLRGSCEALPNGEALTRTLDYLWRRTSGNSGESVRTTGYAMETEQQRRLEQVALEEENYGGLPILLSLHLGLRVGEVCGLHWEDVDWERRIITIRRSVNRVRNWDKDGNARTQVLESGPKSRTSIRELPVPDRLMTLLEQCRRERAGESAYVVCGRQGKRLEPRGCMRLFKRLLEKAGLPDMNFHSLRHTFATRGLASGMDIKTLSELMGHSSVSVTLDIYAHSQMEHKRRGMERMERMYAAVKDNRSPEVPVQLQECMMACMETMDRFLSEYTERN